jgi:hypothetical protein
MIDAAKLVRYLLSETTGLVTPLRTDFKTDIDRPQMIYLCRYYTA